MRGRTGKARNISNLFLLALQGTQILVIFAVQYRWQPTQVSRHAQ